MGITWEDTARVAFPGAVLCLVGTLVLYIGIIWDAKARYWNSVKGAAKEIAALDPQQFQALAMTFPLVRVRWTSTAKPRIMLEDSEIATMTHLAVFLNGSNGKQVFPKRDWHGEVTFRGDTVNLDRTSYEEILNIFIRHRLVIPDSAAGPHSWLWVEGQTTYRNVRMYWSNWLTQTDFGS